MYGGEYIAGFVGPRAYLSPMAWALDSLLPSHIPLWPSCPLPHSSPMWGSAFLHFLVKRRPTGGKEIVTVVVRNIYSQIQVTGSNPSSAIYRWHDLRQIV